jgi:hypothetical protein
MHTSLLLNALRERANDPQRRTDHIANRPLELGQPATPELLKATEQKLGFPLHVRHAQLLVDIGNGGFGPGDGLVGTKGGAPDAHGRHLLDLRRKLRLNSKTPQPSPVVPLCDWGSGIWSCLDAKTGEVLTLDESGLKRAGLAFDEWLWIWSQGGSLWDRIVIVEERSMMNPFTKRPQIFKFVTGTRGAPYV